MRSPVHRSPHDRYLGGVVGGAAERFALDGNLLRMGVVAVLVAAGSVDPGPVAAVVAVYALAWLVLPPVDGRAIVRRLRTPEGRLEGLTAVVVCVAGAVVLVDRSLWPAGALVALAWLLLTDRPEPEPVFESVSETEEFPATPAGPPVPRPARWGLARRGRSAPLPALPVSLHRRPRPRREPALWPMTLALLVGFTVVFAALDTVVEPGLAPSIWVNGALAIVGAVLALSAWRGRARVTLLLVPPLLVGWVAFSIPDTQRHPDGGADVEIAAPPGEVVDVASGYGTRRVTVAPGAVSVDEPLRIEADATAGELTIEVPAAADLVVRGSVGAGELTLSEPYCCRESWTLVGGSTQTVRRAAAEPWCDSWSATPDELAGLVLNTGFEGALDVTDPDAFDPEGPGADVAREFAAYHLGSPVPPTAVVDADGTVVRWETAFEPNTGEPCDPVDESFESLGTVEIDASIGLGVIHVLRIP